MKKAIYLILALASILIITCNSPKKAVIENPYIGAWEKTYSKVIYPDTTIETTKFSNPIVKLLTNKHYAFGSQGGKNLIVGGGGEYTFKDDVFKSFPKYHTGSIVVGDSMIMKSKIESDLWTISWSFNKDSLKFDATETWKRIHE